MTPIESYEPGTEIRPVIHRITQSPWKESSYQGGIIHRDRKHRGKKKVKVIKKEPPKEIPESIKKEREIQRKKLLKKANEIQRKKLIKRGNELRTFRMQRKIGINELKDKLGCANITIIRAEKTTGTLTNVQKRKLRPFYGELVDCFLTVKGEDWKTVQK